MINSGFGSEGLFSQAASGIINLKNIENNNSRNDMRKKKERIV